MYDLTGWLFWLETDLQFPYLQIKESVLRIKRVYQRPPKGDHERDQLKLAVMAGDRRYEKFYNLTIKRRLVVCAM